MNALDIDEFIILANNEKTNNNNIINFVNNKIDGRVCMSDWLHFLLSLKKYFKNDIKTYLEIGTLWGGSISAILQCDNLFNFSTDNYYCVDLFSGYYNSNVSKGDFNKTSINIDQTNHLDFCKKNIELFNKKKKHINFIKGSSYSKETLDIIKTYNPLIDLLFIDGDHSYNGVLNDFNSYKNFLNNGAIVVFDNYGGNAWPEVKKAIDNINFKKEGFKVFGSFNGKESGLYIVQKFI